MSVPRAAAQFLRMAAPLRHSSPFLGGNRANFYVRLTILRRQGNKSFTGSPSDRGHENLNQIELRRVPPAGSHRPARALPFARPQISLAPGRHLARSLVALNRFPRARPGGTNHRPSPEEVSLLEADVSKIEGSFAPVNATICPPPSARSNPLSESTPNVLRLAPLVCSNSRSAAPAPSLFRLPFVS